MGSGISKRETPITVNPESAKLNDLWRSVSQLATELGPDSQWCLVGGLMTQLHAFEHGAPARPTDDIDILGNARVRPSMTEWISTKLDELGARLRTPPATDPLTGYQFELGGAIVEVLGQDGLPEDPKTLGKLRTIQINGGSQALHRTEKVLVSVDGGAPVTVRRPTLLGAILLKGRALKAVPAKAAEHREDLVSLLSFVHDPRAMAEAGELKKSERKWLRSIASDLDLTDPALRARRSEDALERAQDAFELLIS